MASLFGRLSVLATTPAQSSSTYTYDALGRLSKVIRINGNLLKYSHDPAGSQTVQMISRGGLPPAKITAKVVALFRRAFLVIPLKNRSCGCADSCA